MVIKEEKGKFNVYVVVGGRKYKFSFATKELAEGFVRFGSWK